MIGLVRGIVQIVPHNEEWHRLFEEEKEHIRKAVGDDSLLVEHIGSTAICGISAKPILDIMAGIEPFQPELSFVKNLERLGYAYKGENGVPGRHYFGKGVPRTVHLNVVGKGGEFWRSHIAFRDHLKQNADAARGYEQLKLDLASRFPNDRESYTNGKAEFIARILALTSVNSI